MAEIKSTIKIYDGFTPALTKFNKLLSKSNGSLTRLKKQLNQSLVIKANTGHFTASMQRIRDKFQTLKTELNKPIKIQAESDTLKQLNSVLREANKQIEKFKKQDLKPIQLDADVTRVIGALRRAHKLYNDLRLNLQTPIAPRVNLTALEGQLASATRKVASFRAWAASPIHLRAVDKLDSAITSGRKRVESFVRYAEKPITIKANVAQFVSEITRAHGIYKTLLNDIDRVYKLGVNTANLSLELAYIKRQMDATRKDVEKPVKMRADVSSFISEVTRARGIFNVFKRDFGTALKIKTNFDVATQGLSRASEILKEVKKTLSAPIRFSFADKTELAAIQADFRAIGAGGRDLVTVNRMLSRSNNRLATSFRNLASAAGKVAAAYTRINTLSGRLNTSTENIVVAGGGTDKKSNADNIARAAKEQKKFTTSMYLGARASASLHTNIKALAGAYLLWNAAGAVIKLTDSLTQAKGQLNLVYDTMSKSETDVTKRLREQQDLFYNVAQAAIRSRASIFDMAQFIGRLGMNTKGVFKSTDELLAFAETLQKQLVIGRATTQEAASVMLQMTQALGSGRLQGDELRSLLENAPNLTHIIADYMGVAQGQLKELGAQGKITTEIVKNAVLSAIDETNREFNKVPKTFAQMWTIFKNYATLAFEAVLDRLGAFSNSSAMEDILRAATVAVIGLARAVNFTIDTVTWLYNVIKNNFSYIAPIVGAAVVAMAGYNAVILIGRMYALYQAAANAILTASIIAFTFATQGATAGMAALNTVMMANPIGLVVGAVLLLVAGFYYLIKAVNDWCGTSYSATGIIIGALNVLGTLLYNLIAGVWNWIVKFLNAIAKPIVTLEELIYNAFNNGFTGWIDGVKSAIHGLVTFVYGQIKPLFDAYDALKGTNISGKIQQLIDDTWAPSKTEDYVVFDKSPFDDLILDFKSLSEAWKEGNLAGTNIENKVVDYISSWFDAVKGLGKLQDSLGQPENPYDPKSITGKLSNPLNEIAKNTGATADALSATDDELQWLRDVGERQALNRNTNAPISINLNNTSNITKDVDVDDLIYKITQKILEGAVNSGNRLVEVITR